MAIAPVTIDASDRKLVRQFVEEGDGSAFSLLVHRYADMVYSTCRRVLQDEAQAADAVQETFLELARRAGGVTGHVGGWLHRVATRRAIDIIRSNAARRRREAAYSSNLNPAQDWAHLDPLVDEAMESLPDDLRELLLLHYLEGRTTLQIAAVKHTSQPTISRRIQQGLRTLRDQLKAQGAVSGAVGLEQFLAQSNRVAPDALRLSLEKLAGAQATSALGVAAAGAGLKLATGFGAACLVCALGWLLLGLIRGTPDRPAPTPPAGPLAGAASPVAGRSAAGASSVESASILENLGPAATALIGLAMINQQAMEQAPAPTSAVPLLPLVMSSTNPPASPPRPDVLPAGRESYPVAGQTVPGPAPVQSASEEAAVRLAEALRDYTRSPQAWTTPDWVGGHYFGGSLLETGRVSQVRVIDPVLTRPPKSLSR